mmetsp:Transcript_11830/g.15461  ORF Transcript_11830/g.15461 Transcript_11830/m.15461 type:complete len:276 (-) Transcript_11830:253-1080(-)
MNSMSANRLGKEFNMLSADPPPGVCVWALNDDLTSLQAQVEGPPDTPYEQGTFLLEINVPSRYPFEPPKVRFITPIYHPNIDSGGRICLDTLKMQPNGSWVPSINLSTLLTTIRVLMGQPNPDDGLMPEITDLYRKDRNKFEAKARESTEKHAMNQSVKPAAESRMTNHNSNTEEVKSSECDQQQNRDEKVNAENLVSDSEDSSTTSSSGSSDGSDSDDDQEESVKEEVKEGRNTNHSKEHAKNSSKRKFSRSHDVANQNSKYMKSDINDAAGKK